MTTRRRGKPQFDPERLRAGARKVGEALARARGLDPQGWRHTLPCWYGVLPPELAELFATDENLWTTVAHHEGLNRDDLDIDLFDPFDEDLWKVNR